MTATLDSIDPSKRNLATLSSIEMLNQSSNQRMKEDDGGLMLQSSSNTTESPSPTLVAGGQALMEDTMKLQAVAEVDLDRINRERNDKL